MMDTPESGEFKYCKYCGSKMSAGLTVCPNCGRGQLTVKLEAEEGVKRGFEGYVARNMKTVRAVAFLLFISLFLAGLLIGSQTPLSVDEAQLIVGEAEGVIRSGPIALSIAFNNILISLIFFLPIFGVLFLVFVSYSTGMVISGVALLSGSPRSELLLSLLLVPSIWFELAAYSLAATEGALLLLSIPMRRFRKEGKTLAKTVLICATLLTMSAVIESILILG